MTQLLGIRHHGPGSTKSVLKALQANPPDVLLIEAPSDAEALMPFIHPKTKSKKEQNLLSPPIAALVYNPKNFNQAIYLPFAEFSPEWQAMLFAIEQSIPIRFIDLPMSIHFSLDETEKAEQQKKLDIFPEGKQKERNADDNLIRKDPMGYLAKLAGYTDSERWWEVMFESSDNDSAIFLSILKMVSELRKEADISPRTLMREAYMRQMIRKAEKEGFKNIAVVCGAWHTPALSDLKDFKASNDAALLRVIKKIKTTATWIPWSYDRLTFESGYNSGVISPAWYELLFSEKKEAPTRWMVNVARLFREEDMGASSAHVIEAIRMADTLATLRRLAVPGIEELKEAAVTTICEGSPEKLELIEKKLITGSKVGHVPEKIPTVPLQQDIERTVKSARLKKYWEVTEEQWLGGTAAKPQGGIDLREESGKMKSHLLHRLNILDIHWGKLVEINRHQSAGGFTEFWKLKWVPEFAIRIIEMGAWGNTIEEACVSFLRKKTDETNALPALTNLVQLTLNAHLPQSFDNLLEKLENLAALTSDVYHLMDALLPLVQIVKYGSTRGADLSSVEKVVTHLIPRICIGLPGVLVNIDEESSAEAFKKLQLVNRALGILNDPNFNMQWHSTLHTIADSQQINGLLTGACTRILFDKKIFTENEASKRLSFALSPSVEPYQAVQWLEGFLQGSGLLLLHNHALWNILDAWVNSLNEDNFSNVLAVLRRTFSRFSPPERQRMLGLAQQGQIKNKEAVPIENEASRGAVILPTVRKLLGI